MNNSPSAQHETAYSPVPPAFASTTRNTRSAERGPSNRTLAIVVVTAFTLAIVLLFAMPKPAPHEVRITATPEAPLPAPQVTSPDTRVPPQVEPVPAVTSGRVESIVKPVAVTSSAPAEIPKPVPLEKQRAEVAGNQTPPKVIDVTRSEPIAAASARPAADIIVAPAPARYPDATTAGAGSAREEVAARAERPERAAIGATDQAGPVRIAEPQPVPVPAPANE